MFVTKHLLPAMFPIAFFEALMFTFSCPFRASMMVWVARFTTFLHAFFEMSTTTVHAKMLSLSDHKARGVLL